MKTAIVLFAYKRSWHLRQTIESLLRNAGANNYDLIVYSDAPANEGIREEVNKVREYLQTVTGFRSVKNIFQTKNYGLSKSIINGVTNVLKEYEQVIVLEDDMVLSNYFLKYMEEALGRYSKEEKVISIHGYVYPVADTLPETFFLRGADCWGWATWRRGWKLFNPNGQALLDELRKRNLINEFDFHSTYKFSQMLESQIQGQNDSWAVRWYASAFLADKLTLYPGRSLVHNIGTDSSGTHCADSSDYDTSLSLTPIDLAEIEIAPSTIGKLAFEGFFVQSDKNFITKLRGRLLRFIRKMFV